MTHCPTCHQPLTRSTTLIEGETVLRCQVCRRFAVLPPEGIAVEWVPPGADLIDRLKASASDGKRWARLVNSDFDDPMWSSM